MVNILSDELRRAMILTGCNNIIDIKPNMIKFQPNL